MLYPGVFDHRCAGFSAQVRSQLIARGLWVIPYPARSLKALWTYALKTLGFPVADGYGTVTCPHLTYLFSGCVWMMGGSWRKAETSTERR